MKTLEIKAPREVVNGSPQARIHYFDRFVLEHPKIALARKQVCDKLSTIKGKGLIVVAGPTGIGKSTLAKIIVRQVSNDFYDAHPDDQKSTPIVLTSAVPPAGKQFNWKDFWIRLTESAGEVLTDCKIGIPESRQLSLPAIRPPIPVSGKDAAAFRRGVEKCFAERRTRVLVIDEAQHILLADGSCLELVFETLKSLAEITGTTIILVGTHDLLRIRQEGPQLIRRSELISICRYDDSNPEEKIHFASAAAALISHLPIARPIDIEPHMANIYLRSVGSIGLWKDWLMAALEASIHENKPLNYELIQRLQPSNEKVATLTDDAFKGEAAMREMSDEELDAFIKESHAFHFAPPEESTKTSLVPKAPRGKNYAGHRPGTRKATRDPVGMPR